MNDALARGKAEQEDDTLFVDVSLSEKLSSGFEDFYRNVLLQREYSNRAAAQADERGNRPPEVRLGKISSSGRVRLEFTNAMNFPSLEEFVELNQQFDNKLINLVILKDGSEG